jgi:hypothetical protein
MFNNLLTDSNVNESSFIAPNDASGALSTLTYEYWEFDDSEVTVDINIQSASFVNCLSILASGLAGATIRLESSEDLVIFTEQVTKLFVEDGAAMIFLDEAVSAPYFRITISKAIPSTTLVRNIMLGSYLEFEHCLMGQHAPGPYQRKTTFSTNVSGDGQFLGRSVSKIGIASKISFTLLGAAWARADFQNFVEKAITDAYYIAWNVGLYPDEGVYGWTDEDISIKYTGDADKMATNWAFKGFALDRSISDIRRARVKENGTQFRITEGGLFRLPEKA